MSQKRMLRLTACATTALSFRSVITALPMCPLVSCESVCFWYVYPFIMQVWRQGPLFPNYKSGTEKGATSSSPSCNLILLTFYPTESALFDEPNETATLKHISSILSNESNRILPRHNLSVSSPQIHQPLQTSFPRLHRNTLFFLLFLWLLFMFPLLKQVNSGL